MVDTKTIKVTTGVGAARGEVTLNLDERGLVIGISAPSRIYAGAKGQTTRHPWRGRFWNYQPMGGRLLPCQGEVAWDLKAGEFIYWRGCILSWNASVETRPATSPINPR